MDKMSDIVQIISSVGFPIVACLFMFKQNNDLQKTLNEISQTMILMNERIKNIEDSFEEADSDDN